MTKFAGWEMPLYYSGIVDEVEAVRTAAGVFNLSHMGEIIVSGRNALATLQFITTNDISVLESGRAQYTLMCAEDGGIIEDLIVYRLDSDRYMLVVYVVNIQPVEARLLWVSEVHEE
jgi:aminomethyltransferase